MADRVCAPAARGPLREGETIVLLDRKGRLYLKRLAAGRDIQVRGGTIPPGELIGAEEGLAVRSSLNEEFVVFRPTLAQLIPNLPRSAQVIYPKDIGAILVWGDLFPGATVVEAGVGPAALTLALLRAVGPEGKVVSYEIRPDFADMARANVARFYGAAENWTLKIGDVALELTETGVDRVLLDLPEPWTVTDRAWECLKPGGILLGYVPTALQVKSFVDSLRSHGGFTALETFETLMRFWHVKGLSVRPEHRMVAHTGFVTIARRMQKRHAAF
ncbi:MAG TPA: tRNA (adenine-N1)-methyltransferase [Candidatus Acidoferrales bacterium]|nr:tRNA (adenine-N1)-methyltransferase [Candidatus Acidoferrales bacterium]